MCSPIGLRRGTARLVWFPTHQKLPMQDSDRVILLNGPRCQRPHSINWPNKTRGHQIKMPSTAQFRAISLNLPTAETEKNQYWHFRTSVTCLLGASTFIRSDTVYIQNNFCPWRLWMTPWRHAQHQRFMLGQRQWLVSQLSGRDSRGS